MKKEKRTKLTRSVRRYIREEKGRIRKAAADPKAEAQKIAELYGRFGISRVK